MKREPSILLTAPTETREEDCACPDHAFRMETAAPRAPLYIKTPNTHRQMLNGAYQLLMSPFAPKSPSVVNRPTLQRWEQFTTPRPLSDTEIDQQLLEQALLQPAGTSYKPILSQGETLTAWMHVTNACNLDCPYCYVRKSSARMSLETGLNGVRQLFFTAEKHNFKRVKLKYAGGEATLHFKLIRALHDEAQRLSDATGIRLSEVVLSNGYRITPDDAQWMLDAGVKLMVSLDGVGEAHDQQRPLKGGGSTFAQIEKTVDDTLLPLGLIPDISITITGMNAGGAADAVRWALERNLPISLNFYRQNLLSASRQELDLEEKAIIDGMLDAYTVFEEKMPAYPFLNGLLDRVQMEAHGHTCGVQHSYLVITHSGKLSQCQMHLDEPVHDTIEGDLLPMVAGGTIQNVSVDEKEGCRECEFRYRCTGGCPLETYRATGRWDIRSPHCHIYKTLFPQALRLEGLRLLKVNRLLC